MKLLKHIEVFFVKKALHFPNPNEDRKISLGPVIQSDGCIRERLKDSHSDFWTQYRIV